MNLFTALYLCLSLCLSNAQGTLEDYDGNKYRTVLIGDQVWMAENLKSIHNAAGEKIKRVCYQLKRGNCDTYGGLYAWDDLNILPDSLQGICPDGWHVPSDEDWNKLVEYLGGADSASYILNKDTLLGFNMQYGGNYHKRLRNYNYLGKIAYFWTADEYSPTAAWMRMINPKNVNLNRSTIPKTYCLSVRCVKDKAD